MGFQFLGLGVFQYQNQALAVGRPLERVDTLQRIGELNTLASLAEERPDLALLFAAGRQKGQVLAVRAPPGARGGLFFPSQGDGVFAFDRHHPDPSAGLVFFEVEGGYRVGDPAAVGRHLGIGYPANAEVVVDREGPRFAVLAGGVGCHRSSALPAGYGQAENYQYDPDLDSHQDSPLSMAQSPEMRDGRKPQSFRLPERSFRTARHSPNGRELRRRRRVARSNR